jgi:hypothetical protein
MGAFEPLFILRDTCLNGARSGSTSTRDWNDTDSARATARAARIHSTARPRSSAIFASTWDAVPGFGSATCSQLVSTAVGTCRRGGGRFPASDCVSSTRSPASKRKAAGSVSTATSPPSGVGSSRLPSSSSPARRLTRTSMRRPRNHLVAIVPPGNVPTCVPVSRKRSRSGNTPSFGLTLKTIARGSLV